MTKHKVLIVGVGSIGERHLRCFQNTGRADLSLCEINEKLRQEVAARYGIARSFSRFEDALADKPQVALIATPAPWHVAQSTVLAEAGVHVLIEKPLGTSLEGVERLQQAIARTGVTVGVAYVYHVFPALAAMRQAIRDGRFGKPVQVVAVCGQHFPTYRPAYRTIYYNDRRTGGGAIQDALTHILNAAEWMVGPIDRIFADADHQVLEGVNVEDTAHVLTRHGKVLGCYSLNQYQAPNQVEINVVCERGTVRYEGQRNTWMWMTQPAGTWTEENFGAMERDSAFVAQAAAFLDAVQGRGAPPCTLAEGIQTLRVNLAALASLDSKTWETI